ncbi:hypothetical protein CDD83_11015 [Cordyceps sp. RAO-2017]|nr:hypothetical protein CDD83_11015 [Cordyceps sp. RAO-2017]
MTGAKEAGSEPFSFGRCLESVLVSDVSVLGPINGCQALATQPRRPVHVVPGLLALLKRAGGVRVSILCLRTRHCGSRLARPVAALRRPSSGAGAAIGDGRAAALGCRPVDAALPLFGATPLRLLPGRAWDDAHGLSSPFTPPCRCAAGSTWDRLGTVLCCSRCLGLTARLAGGRVLPRTAVGSTHAGAERCRSGDSTSDRRLPSRRVGSASIEGHASRRVTRHIAQLYPASGDMYVQLSRYSYGYAWSSRGQSPETGTLRHVDGRPRSGSRACNSRRQPLSSPRPSPFLAMSPADGQLCLFTLL